MIETRFATPLDFPIIQQIALDTYYVTYGPLLPKEKLDYLYDLMYTIQSLTEQVEKKGHKFILAKDEIKYLGYASYELNCDNSSTTKIHKLYILPTAQGKGVGKALMTRITELALQKKNQTLSLNVYRKNPAIEFYQKIGFQKTGEVNIPIGNGFMMEDFVMEKNIEKTELITGSGK